MKPDDFENLLKRQPLRPVPGEWREEILATALQAGRPAGESAPSPARRGGGLAAWRGWFWPHPVAWGALAAAWALIAALNTASGLPLFAEVRLGPPRASQWAAQSGSLDELVEPAVSLKPARPARRPDASVPAPSATWSRRHENEIA